MDEIDALVVLEIPHDLILKRLTNRRTCSKCGAIYNIHPDLAPHPKEEGKCDKCRGELIQRADDTAESIQRRLNIYQEETKPILEKYSDKIVQVDASASPDENMRRVIDALEEKGINFD